MSNITYLTSLVSSLAERLNQIEANAKRIFELPQQSPIDGDSKFAVSRPLQLPLTGEVTEYMTLNEIVAYIGVTPGGFAPTITDPQTGDVIQYIDGIWVNSSLDLNGDRFTVVQPIDVTGLDITLPIGFKWVINGVEYENTSAFLQTIALSSAGTERGDIFVANENNTFEYIQGVEDVANVVYPQAPPNKLFLTSIKVNDSSISAPIDPVIGNNYITKFSEKLNQINVTDGYIIPISEDRRTFYINNSDEDSSILGCERASGYNNTLWSGSDIWVWNNSENDVILKNDSGNPDVEFKFIFSETGEDFILKPNSKAHFKYNGFNDTFEFFGSSLGGGTPSASTSDDVTNESDVTGATVTEALNNLDANISKAGFVQRTGTAIAFDKWATYGTYAAPSSGNLSYSFTDAIVGCVQVLYHEDVITPTFSQVGIDVDVDELEYQPNVVNEIIIFYRQPNKIRISITPM